MDLVDKVGAMHQASAIRAALRTAGSHTAARSAPSTSRREQSVLLSGRRAGLFRQYNAPADFVETANTIGLPRYAKQAADQQFARWVMLHVQSNPLPICTRPRVLIKGKRT
jgi:hypothetical protein